VTQRPDASLHQPLSRRRPSEMRRGPVRKLIAPVDGPHKMAVSMRASRRPVPGSRRPNDWECPLHVGIIMAREVWLESNDGLNRPSDGALSERQTREPRGRPLNCARRCADLLADE
jgi:hypothetical protein